MTGMPPPDTTVYLERRLGVLRARRAQPLADTARIDMQIEACEAKLDVMWYRENNMGVNKENCAPRGHEEPAAPSVTEEPRVALSPLKRSDADCIAIREYVARMATPNDQ